MKLVKGTSGCYTSNDGSSARWPTHEEEEKQCLVGDGHPEGGKEGRKNTFSGSGFCSSMMTSPGDGKWANLLPLIER